jgi:hypothetical protein
VECVEVCPHYFITVFFFAHLSSVLFAPLHGTHDYKSKSSRRLTNNYHTTTSPFLVSKCNLFIYIFIAAVRAEGLDISDEGECRLSSLIYFTLRERAVFFFNVNIVGNPGVSWSGGGE